MADIRALPGATPPSAPARPMPAARAQAIAAAQRAFFDQALNASLGTTPTRASPPAEPAPAPSVTRLAFDPTSPAPDRPLRPGSLLDIKV